MAQAIAYRGGSFFLELAGKYAGYLRKVDLGGYKGDVVTHNLGGAEVQKKHVVKMSHDPIKFEIGVGMGKEVYDWIKTSFDNKHMTQNGAIMICNEKYEVVRRVDFTEAHITKITLPKVDAKSKESMYFSVEMQPTTMRHSAGGGKAQVTIGENQKMFGSNMFRLLSPLGDTKSLISIDAMTWTQKVHETAYGEFIESTHTATMVEVGDMKMTLSSHVYEQWEKKAKAWFVDGQREEKDEVTQTLQLLAHDGKTIVGEVTFENCGMKAFSFSALEANKDSLNTFDVTCYVEKIRFDIKKYN